MNLGSLLYLLTLCLFPPCFARNPSAKFRPVLKKSSLGPRSLDFEPSLSPIELLYVEEYSLPSQPLSGARLTFDPLYPTLFLDDLSHHFSHVECMSSGISLGFRSETSKNAAYQSWRNANDFLLVTLETCHTQSGTHDIYLASSVLIADIGLKISAAPISFKECAKNAQIKFGNAVYREFTKNDEENLVGNDEKNLWERQASQSAPLPFPSPTAPSGPPGPSRVSHSIATSFIDTKILPPSNAIAREIGSLVIPPGIRLRCVNCTTTGTLELSDGNINFNDNSDTHLQGYFNLFAKDVTAHVALELQLLPGFISQQFTAQLPPIPIPDLGIPLPGSLPGALGMFFIFEIVMGVQYNSTIDFFAGLEIEVPPASEIHLDLGNPSASFSHGFSNAHVRLLPFNMHSTAPEFIFSASLQPHLQIGLDLNLAVSQLDASVGIFLDAPELEVSVDLVTNVNDKCEPTKTNPVGHELIKIDPTAIIDLGAYAEVENIATSAILLSTSIPLPTVCLEFNPKSHQLVDAAAQGEARLAFEVSFGCVVLAASILVLSLM